jgi:hypothetical protein
MTCPPHFEQYCRWLASLPLVGRQEFLAGGHLDRLRLPQREGIHGAGAPGAAILAMAVAHREWRASGLILTAPQKQLPS